MTKHLHAGWLEVGDELPAGRIAGIAREDNTFAGPWPIVLTLEDGRVARLSTADKVEVVRATHARHVLETEPCTLTLPEWCGGPLPFPEEGECVECLGPLRYIEDVEEYRDVVVDEDGRVTFVYTNEHSDDGDNGRIECAHCLQAYELPEDFDWA